MVTLKDIAKRANVSVATVSNVLNNKKGRVSIELRQEIIDLANEMGYIPNQSAKQLVTQKSNTIGIIVPDLENFFFANIVSKLQMHLSEKGYVLLMTISNDLVENDLSSINFLMSRGVEAIIIASSNHARTQEEKYLETFKNSRIPIIMIDRILDKYQGPKIRFDDHKGMFDITNYVLEQGHEDIAFIDGDYAMMRTYGRLHGFLEALESKGIKRKDRLIFQGDYNFETGYKLAPEIMKENPTAVVISNDMMAYGFLKYVLEIHKGSEIPISITGYDNVIFSEMIHPALTTVSQSIELLAEAILKMLYDVLKTGSKDELVILPTKLMIRDSVKNID